MSSFELAQELEKALRSPVRSMGSRMRSNARSKHGIRSGVLAGSFSSRIDFYPDGWGVIRWKTTRYAYILNYGHDYKKYDSSKKQYSRKIKGSGIISDAVADTFNEISDIAAAISADFVVKLD